MYRIKTISQSIKHIIKKYCDKNNIEYMSMSDKRKGDLSGSNPDKIIIDGKIKKLNK